MEDPLPMYAPRDDAFEEGRMAMLEEGNKKAMRRVFVPALVSGFSDGDLGGLHHVDSLFKDGLQTNWGLNEDILGKNPLVRKIQEATQGQLLFDTPNIISSEHQQSTN